VANHQQDESSSAGGGDDDPALPERLVRRFDDLHNEHPTLGYPIAVVRKYADDRGSAFAALLTHYAFLALFPLLVLLLTVLDRLRTDNPELQERIVDSVVAQLPAIGERLQAEASPLAVGGVMVVISGAALFWGATGLYNSAQLVMSQIWNVEGVQRTGFVGRLWRAAVLFASLGAGALISATAWWSGLFVPTTVAIHAGSILGIVLLNAVLLFVGLRIVTPPAVPTSLLAAPALAIGVVWEVLRFAGQWIVEHRVSDQEELYGVFALVLVALAWINLVARAVVFFVEAQVVRTAGLWPRRLAQPPFTEADREALDRIVRNEHRRPEQVVEVSWEDPDDVSEDDATFRASTDA
jgi:YihY family inner membrane protein